MKNLLLLLTACLLSCNAFCRGSVNSEVKLKELAVPNAPAFQLLDVAPTQIENPTNPKQFALGIAKSFNDSIGFPQNYSMEFAPYWWLKSSNRSVYDFLGLKTVTNPEGSTGKKVVGEDPFAGIKFTSLSLAFVNQDMVPDGIKQSQKVLSVGVHSNIVRIHSKRYAAALQSKLEAWHKAAQKELEALDIQPLDTDSAAYVAYWQNFTDFTPKTTARIYDDISDLIVEKPLFSLNIAAAYSVYGVDDSTWTSGRTGIWTTASSYLPLNLDEKAFNKNYLALHGYFRFLKDNYAAGKDNVLLKSSCIDIGLKAELQFDKLSIAYETTQRNYQKENIASRSRNVGIVSYQLNNNLYLNGTFGKDFGINNKLISSLGINWGFGTEKINLD